MYPEETDSDAWNHGRRELSAGPPAGLRAFPTANKDNIKIAPIHNYAGTTKKERKTNETLEKHRMGAAAGICPGDRLHQGEL